MRVTILSQYFDPEPIPKAGDIARALRDHGHEVTVITGFPNYPSGRLYDSFKLRLLQRYEQDGIPIIRTFELPYHGKSVIGRIVNYCSFALSAPLGALIGARSDVMYVWHPPLTVGLAAWLISVIRGMPFVYDVQDVWPESAVLSGLMKEGFLVRGMSMIERFVYRRAAHILVVTEGARQNLMAKGVPADKVTVMPNWVDESLFDTSAEERREAVRSRLGWQGRFVVLFAGNLGLVQGLDSVVLAATHLPSSSKVLIALVGDGSDRERLVGLAREQHVEDRVQFVDRQPMSRMPEFMAASDALLVHLRRSELSRFIIPSKTLAYLAAGRPIIMAMEGAAADLVSEAGAGIVIPPDDPVHLARTIESLAAMRQNAVEQFGKNGRSYLQANLAKERVIARYEELLSRVARKNGRA
ncbi:MAG TPA: glycosyltransferase family 4 protein [Thermoanaerobaculia bacterium]|nr:glycosyltransferase family 4 protein [Thermoanaerobaculia bacterium]